jgi:hypothetical protein
MFSLVDTHVCKTEAEINATSDDLDAGVGVDNLLDGVEEANQKKKKNTDTVFNPKNKDDPFRRENWSF